MLNNLSIGRKLALIALVPFLLFLAAALPTLLGDGGGDTSNYLAIGLLAALVVGLALVFLVSKSIKASLAELRDEAANIANSDLPRLADALSNGVPVAQLASDREPLDVGDSEFGEVASSLTAVRESANAVGERVSVLQGGIADTFVNLARRNQSLVDRQLEAIDTLEAEERDSDRLALMYRVDHLATRMRRNAESLLVLADAKTPERHSPAVELREVLRVAIGEVEDYRRIIPISLDDMHVAGHKAQDLAHLLAELMENAAQHSPPGTAVDVSGAYDGATGNYVVHILDHGTGVDATQLARLNELLQRTPTSTMTISHSIGLQVVSRLAHALGLMVRLDHAEDGGLSATVVIPSHTVTEWAQSAPAGATTSAAPAPAIAPLPIPDVAPAPLPETAPDAGLMPLPETPTPDVGLMPLPEPLPEVAPFAEAAPAVDVPDFGAAAPVDDGIVQMPAPEAVPTIDMPGLDLPSFGVAEPEPVAEVFTPEPAPEVFSPEPVAEVFTPEAAPEVFSPEPVADAFTPQPAPEVFSPEPVADAFTPQPAPQVFSPEPVAEVFTPQPAPEVFSPEPVAEVFTPEPAPEVFSPEPVAEAPAPMPVIEPIAPVPAPMPIIEPVAEAPAPMPVIEPIAPVPAPMPIIEPVAEAPAPMPVIEPIAPVPAPMPIIEPVAEAPAPMPAPIAAPPAMPTPHIQPDPLAAPPVQQMPAPAPPVAPAPMPTLAPPTPQPAPVAETAAPAATTAGGLTRRKRSSVSTAPVDLEADRTAPSQRTPDQVKNMLSRYKTGLERGRGVAETDGES